MEDFEPESASWMCTLKSPGFLIKLEIETEKKKETDSKDIPYIG
jgi:hypothetical protein